MRPAEHWIETVADVVCFSAVVLLIIAFLSLTFFMGTFIAETLGL